MSQTRLDQGKEEGMCEAAKLVVDQDTEYDCADIIGLSEMLCTMLASLDEVDLKEANDGMNRTVRTIIDRATAIRTRNLET